MKAITCMIISLLAVIPSQAKLSPEEAITRMESYGLILPTDNEGRTHGIELR